MLIAFKITSGITALLHLCFLILEMFLWATPTGLKVFKMTAHQAELTKVLAMNQGLYNGFLSAGIIWALIQADLNLAVLFLIFVVIAGVFGALTVGPSIFFIQALPAIIALALRFFL